MMDRLSDLFRQLLVDGVGITLAPWCVIGVILILSGPRPLRKAIAFLLGAATTMTAIMIACELLVGRLEVTDADTASSRVEWVKLALALLLLGYGLWRLRRPPAPPSTPRWLTLIDRLTVPTSFAIGLLMPNPIFAAAGGIQIVKVDLCGTGHRRLAGLLHPGSLSSMITPVVLYARSPAATGLRLAGWKQWARRPHRETLTWMCIGYGGLIAVESAIALFSRW